MALLCQYLQRRSKGGIDPVSAFEFVFSLLGLLLGFSLIEVLGGLSKALKARKSVRIGWLTPFS